MSSADQLVSVEEAARALGVSLSTVWRRIRSGTLATVRRGGRRLVWKKTLARGRAPISRRDEVPAFTSDHPIFRLVGAGRSGGVQPGARDKHAILAP